MGVLGYIQEKWSDVRESWANNRVAFRVLPFGQEGRSLPNLNNFENASKEGFRAHAIIYACVKEIAKTAADPDLQVRKVETSGSSYVIRPDMNEKGSDLAKLLQRPNPEQTQYEFLERLIIHLLVGGNAYILKLRSQVGKVAQLRLIRPDRVRVKPNQYGEVAGYIIDGDGDDSSGDFKPVSEIIHIVLPDSWDEFEGLSPVSVASSVANLDKHSINYLIAFFENAGQPSGFLKLKTKTFAKERERIKQLWKDEHGSRKGWHTISVIDADAEFHELGSRPDELRLEGIFDQTETRVCMTMGVHPLIIGTRIGMLRATLNNLNVVRKRLYEDTAQPIFKRIEEKLTFDLASDFGSSFKIVFDLSKIPALGESIDARDKRARDNFRGGLLTRNRARQIIGEPAVQGGDVFMQEANLTLVPGEVKEKRDGVQ